ncbi:MAG TPA: putative Ig domain-containing protein [Blastocatellia bacterium]|nr:putative Ig domain-containing protein [Blastocatellia bacterium]
MSSRSHATWALLALGWLLGLSVAASATTIVPMTDEDLAVSVRAIVEGTVLHSEPVWDSRRGAVITYVTVDVETVLKGSVTPGPLVLKQFGGRTATEVTETFGSPEFADGTRVLLFLNTDAAGALRIAHFSLGAYRIEPDPSTGIETVRRCYGETVPVDGVRQSRSITDTAPLASFVESVRGILAAHQDRVAEFDAKHASTPVLQAPPEYPARLTFAGGATPSFSFLPPGFRWFESDTGGSVMMRVNTKEAPTPTHGIDESKLGLEAWSAVTGSSMKMTYIGATKSGGRIKDGVNSISFGDPLDEMDDPVNCTGVVALSGVTATLAQQVTIGGHVFVRIAEGDVVVNDHFDCLLADSITLSEVVTHEIGHTIGLAHSSDSPGEADPILRDATMFFATHIDGRGATLRQDDVAAARFLYNGTAGSQPLGVSNAAIPDAQPGSFYSYDLDQTGGSSPYVWSLASGTLPSGVALGQDGHLFGKPTAAGTYAFSLVVRDGRQAEARVVLTLRVTTTPAPFVEHASYREDTTKLTVGGQYLEAGATVTINGEVVAEGAPVKFKSKRNQLVVGGSPTKLNIRAPGQNTITVAIGGVVSNTVTF